MTRFAIDRKNRDRKGGHKTTPLARVFSSQCVDGVYGTYTPVERSLLKREGKKALRRQHNKAINEGIALMAQEQEDRQQAYWSTQEALYWDSNYDLDWMNKHDEPEPYEDYLDELDCGDPECEQCGRGSYFSNYTRVRPNTRVLDQNTIEHLADEVQRGMVNLELEAIENRDAGKSLGQLLRERLSRPF